MKEQLLIAEHDADHLTLIDIKYRTLAPQLPFELLTARTIDQAVSLTQEHNPEALIFNHIYPGGRVGFDLLRAEVGSGRLYQQVPLKILFTGADLTEQQEQLYRQLGVHNIFSRMQRSVVLSMLKLVDEHVRTRGRDTSQTRKVS